MKKNDFEGKMGSSKFTAEDKANDEKLAISVKEKLPGLPWLVQWEICQEGKTLTTKVSKLVKQMFLWKGRVPNQSATEADP